MKKLIFSFILVFGLASTSHGKNKPWKAKSETTFMNTTGNTRTQSFGSKNSYDYDWSKTALRTNFNAYAVREEGKATAENYLASEKFEWKYKKPNYLYQLGKWEKDRFAGLDSRLTLGGGYGRLFIDNALHRLLAELGVQESWEDRKNQRNEKFGSLRAYGDYTFKISETANFNQTVEYIKDFIATRAFRINTVTSVTAKMTTILSLKASYEIKFDNDPIPGFSKTDTITTIGILIEI